MVRERGETSGKGQAVLQGVASRGINAVLYVQFEHLQEDAIKGQRREKQSRDLVAEYVQSLRVEEVAQVPTGQLEEVTDLNPRDLRKADAATEVNGEP